MTDVLAQSAVLGWTLLAVLATCAMLVVLTAARRLQVGVTTRRREALERPVRPLVLTLAADADDDGEAYRTLATAPPDTWAAIEPLVVRVLGKVRGDARGTLTELLELHGAADRALRGITARGAVRRALAAETLGLLGAESSTAPLRACLHDRAADVRRVAVRALGRIGDPTVAPALIDTLDGSRPVPAQSVIQALLRLGPGVAPHLVPALQDRSEAVRAAVAEVLGLLRAVSATHPLIATLAEDPSLDVRLRAVKALGGIGHPTAVGALLSAIGSTEDPLIRAAAARALGELGSDRAVRALVGLLYEQEHAVALAAANSLVQLGKPGVEALTEVLRLSRPGRVPGRTCTGLPDDELPGGAVATELRTIADPDGRTVTTAACYAAAALVAARRAEPE
ncbi:HEAT repeat domain-containing protein [Cryptosporangium minutisporangium]|uniref:HEAT repeat domain-containing protein n=1 Tax=Cryptosporangium minutisporangium TaxID=113569 RepID=A0ABP6SSC3_9ACTN